MQTDIDLIISRVLAGDTECYSEIVRLHQREVAKVVAAMLFDRQESEDLVQEVFVRAFEHLDQFRRGKDMGLWLKGIARNTVRMHLRSRTTAQKHLDAYRGWLARHYEENAAEDYLEQRRRALLECLGNLPEQSRRLMEMRYRHELAIQKISEAIGKSIDALTKALSRIREGLRDCVSAKVAAT